MAGTLQTQISVVGSNPPVSDQWQRTATITQANRGQIRQLLTLPANHTEVAFSFTGLTGVGVATIENIGEATTPYANEVLYGPLDGGGTLIGGLQIMRGEQHLLRFKAGFAWKAKTGASETAIGKLLITVNEA